MAGARRGEFCSGRGEDGAAQAVCGEARRGLAEAWAASGGSVGHWRAWRRAAVATGAREEAHSGELLGAAQWTKCSRGRLRSKRRERGNQGRGLLPLSHAGVGHPPRWFSALLPKVAAARGAVVGCWGDPEVLLVVWGSLWCTQKRAWPLGRSSGPDWYALWWPRWFWRCTAL